MRAFAQLCHIDGVLRYALGTRIWQALSGFFTLALILRYTQPVEQGLFYTFNSILNLQIFFELGLSFVVLQCTPHYFKSLTWGEQGKLLGATEHRDIFLMFARKGLRLYGIIAISFVALMIPIGWVFFGLRQADSPATVWLLPWILLVLGTSLNLCLSPILALLEGSGRIREVYRLRWRLLMIANCVAWCVFFLTNALYLSVVNVWLTVAMTCYWLYKTHKQLLLTLLKPCADPKGFSWLKEIWPMQWRIAITWISGYFIGQIFTPLIFYYHGSVLSGQMGVCLTVMNMLGLFAITWVTVRSPQMGDLVARAEYQQLDKVFFKALWQSIGIFVLGALGIGFLLYLCQGHAVMARFLPWQEIALLLIAYLFVHIIGALSLYIRAHKIELFTPLSVVGACLVTLCAWFSVVTYGSLGVCWSILMVNACYGFPSALWLWMRFKRNSHSHEEQKSNVFEAYH
ncbi:MAG: hypothetical protein CK424_03015 [Legionella sp.]|nr:MAG: hypothetical protein CK424_03015 [Legionella sp.]